jgi:hypothetical protein
MTSTHSIIQKETCILLGLCGKIGSGKDSVANYLKTNYDFHVFSFANILKDILSVAFGWDRCLLQGDTIESRKWREEIDVWWANKLQIPHLTPRWVLQHWGTDLIRNHFHLDFWVLSLERKIHETIQQIHFNKKKNISQNKHLPCCIVVTDCRFPNEFELIHRLGGIIMELKREVIPYSISVSNVGSNSDSHSLSHISEKLHTGFANIIIDNNDTLDSLYSKIDTFILSFTTTYT